jgi:RNA polymerase sigma-70 factor (ECF subfamily)
METAQVKSEETVFQDKIGLLPESYQTVIVLHDLMEFRHNEIAEILDISVENVKVRLQRARKKLKMILEEHCSFEVDKRNVLVCDPVTKKELVQKWNR